jgi:hypothetical protein
MTRNNTDIELPAELVEQCEARIAESEFETVEEYVQFVVSAVVDEADPPGRSDAGSNRDETVSEDVEDRLASLGYK